MPRTPYRKELTEPILPDHRPNDGLPKTRDRSQKAREDARIEQERSEKVMMLFEHYLIDPRHPEAWKYLALHLAVDHVKGLSISKGRGQPKKWTPARLQKVYLYYLLAKREFLKSNKYTNATDDLVGRRMLKDDNFQKDFPGTNISTLRNIISNARQRREASIRARREGRYEDIEHAGVSAFFRKYGNDSHEK